MFGWQMGRTWIPSEDKCPNVMSGFIKPQLFGEIPCAKEAGFALLESLAQGPSPSRPES